MKCFFFALSSFFFVTVAFGQAPNFSLLNVPRDLLIDQQKENSFRKEIYNASFLDAYDLTRSLPRGYVKNGTRDYTDYLQRAIDRYDKVIFPNFPILIDTKGLNLRSNTKLYFPENGKLIMKTNNLKGYEMLMISNVINVEIYFPNLEGDRKRHQGKEGEFGFPIRIAGSENITVHYGKITDSWGDGIHISDHYRKPYKNEKLSQPLVWGIYVSKRSKNISIHNVWIDNCRRNGISVISVDNLLIDGCLISNTNGTNPQSGIDLEPNGDYNILKDIRLNNIKTFNNRSGGIIVGLVAMNGTTKRTIDVSVNNHLDKQSFFGFGLYLHKNEANLTGSIKINSPRWMDNWYGPMFVPKGNRKNRVNIQIVNPSGTKSNKPGYKFTWNDYINNEIKNQNGIDLFYK
ncbi:MAG: right-handed parallel beta-helix repeat-containing protein [Bacteroidales bacterium]|nr:right-handed parallel beta-helix repeat-containing protein [Bacteroidales bacterium]